jgi:O-antigen biosynthesis protein
MQLRQVAPSSPPYGPAAAVLDAPFAPMWALFDAAWYRTKYRAVGDDAALREEYLAEGARRSRSPNPWFDEAWVRVIRPDIVDALSAGQFASAFDACCRGAVREIAMHWLYDLDTYAKASPDLTKATLALATLWDRYDHLLRFGAAERRPVHPLFHAQFYLARLDPADRSGAQSVGPWKHFIAGPAAGGVERRTTALFDPNWYRARYRRVERAIAAGRYHSALHHYLVTDEPEAFDPLPLFNEAEYRAQNADVQEAIAEGIFARGYEHFLAFGAGELRSPGTTLDLRAYVDSDPSIAADLRAGRAPDPFTHYLLFHRAVDETAEAAPVDPGQGRTLARARAEALLPMIARVPLDFTLSADPVLSVVVVLRNEFRASLAGLAALRHGFAGPIDLILVDSASDDECTHMQHYVSGARLLRLDIEIGLAAGRRIGLNLAASDRVLLLGPGVLVAPGSVAAALRRLDADPAIGAVCGRVLGPDGRLMEAGCAVASDGTVSPLLAGAAANAAEATYVREADAASGAFLLADTTLLVELDAADDDPGQEGWAVADLCLRMPARGRRLVFDPAVLVDATAAPAEPAPSGEERAAFAIRHAEVLASRLTADAPAGQAIAAAAPARKGSVLVIGDRLPLRRMGAAEARGCEIIAALVRQGARVSVCPLQPAAGVGPSAFADLPDKAELLHDRLRADLPDLLRDRTGLFDTIWFASPRVFRRVGTAVFAALQEWPSRPRLVLDIPSGTVAPPIADAPEDGLADTLAEAIAGAGACDVAVTATEGEAEALRSLGVTGIRVLGDFFVPRPTAAPFAERAGMLFAAVLDHPDAAPLAGLAWLVDAVLPLVEAELGWETRLTVAGHIGRGIDLARFADHPRVTLAGGAADMQGLYASHRLALVTDHDVGSASWRVREAAAFGVPTVVPETVARALGWQHDSDLMSAPDGDAALLAAAAIRLYRDDVLWTAVREAALRRVSEECAPDAFDAGVARIVACTPGLALVENPE